MRDTIIETLRSFNLDDYRPIQQRTLDLGEPLTPRVGNLVKAIIGMRRSGKSYRLMQEIDRAIAAGVSPESICYFNFEDDRLAPVTPAVGDLVLEAFETLHPGALEHGAYLFLDELQEMDGWGAWMRRVVDATKATIYVSGSSSKLLSREISTEFRGRALDFELLPYSFAEYALAKEPGLDIFRPSLQDRVALQRLVGDYLRFGGFPATIELPPTQATSLLQSYVDQVVARDIIERHDIARPRVASAFARRVLGTNAMPLSIRKIENDLRSAGLKTSREFLADMLGYLEDAYLVFPVRQFSYSLSERTTSARKIYAIDPGLALASSRANSNALGQRLENAVYLELRRRTNSARPDAISTYVTKNGYEVDFVVGDALEHEAYKLVQVCADASAEKTLMRELRALQEGLRETRLSEGELVVLDGEETRYEADGLAIHQIPAWKWLLQPHQA